MIARHGMTKRDQLSRAVDNLRAVNGRILGTIITMTPTRKSDTYYGYAYQYSQGKKKS